jgi:hypothetical protein
MTLAYYAGKLITGTKADRTGGTWTNLPAGWKFLETDPNPPAFYYWTGSAWVKTADKSSPAQGKRGSFWGISQTAGCDGMFQGAGAAITVGTGAAVGIQRDSTGLSYRLGSGTTINSLSGTKIAGLYTERDYNPVCEWQIAVQQTTDTRCFFGFMSSVAPVSGADPLNALSGVLFGLDTGVNGNWHIYQNSGSGASDSTTIPNVAAADTSAHKFALRADNANTKFQYAYGHTDITSATWVDINTKIPAATTGMGWGWWIECLVGSATKTFQTYYVDHYQDK